MYKFVLHLSAAVFALGLNATYVAADEAKDWNAGALSEQRLSVGNDLKCGTVTVTADKVTVAPGVEVGARSTVVKSYAPDQLVHLTGTTKGVLLGSMASAVEFIIEYHGNSSILLSPGHSVPRHIVDLYSVEQIDCFTYRLLEKVNSLQRVNAEILQRINGDEADSSSKFNQDSKIIQTLLDRIEALEKEVVRLHDK